MPVINALSTNKIATLSIIALLAFGLISLWSINLWQQTLLKKITLAQPEKMLKKERLEQAINDKKKPLVFAQVDLPELPEMSKPSMDLLKKSSNIPEPMVKKTKQKPPREQSVSQAKRPTKTAAKKSTSAIYQQLISDSSINIELAWPNETSARQALFSFLYQCVGMKFGVLNKQNVTLAKMSFQDASTMAKQQPSEWLRLAQGQLANQEHHWLQQYNLSGTPVRLFPKAVDWQLAKLVNNQLNGAPLKSLRAHYTHDNQQHDNQRLQLTNIRLNGQLLSNDWTLTENKCASAK